MPVTMAKEITFQLPFAVFPSTGRDPVSWPPSPSEKLLKGFLFWVMYHLDQLIIGHCPFRKGDRVWILESWGLVAGVVELVGEWAMSDKTKLNTPFIKVEYDFKTPHGRTDAHFWRDEDLKKLRRQHAQTNCCFAPFYQVDQYLHGKCTECGENATPMEPDEFQQKYTHKAPTK